jgi:hypothetical protein
LLIAYENLSDMKINFNNYELISLNFSTEKGNSLANILCRKLTNLPLMYLEMSMHWKKISIEHRNFLIEK